MQKWIKSIEADVEFDKVAQYFMVNYDIDGMHAKICSLDSDNEIGLLLKEEYTDIFVIIM